ncbi:hypothetical protein [Paenibacillus sp. A14]|uniref:hypothetical protein n=1 Tax=Paenibacillus sp. A14 TaxID=3119820 RepID=UPI002FE32DAD
MSAELLTLEIEIAMAGIAGIAGFSPVKIPFLALGFDLAGKVPSISALNRRSTQFRAN